MCEMNQKVYHYTLSLVSKTGCAIHNSQFIIVWVCFSGVDLYKKQDILIILASHQDVQELDLFVQKQFIKDIVSTLTVSDCGQWVSIVAV